MKCCYGCGQPPGAQQGDGCDMGQCTYTIPGGERCGTWYHLFCQVKAAGNGERCPLHGAPAAAPPLPAVPKPAAKAAEPKPAAKAAEPKPVAKAAEPKPARQREIPAVSQEWPEDLRKQQELHRLLAAQVRGFDNPSDPLGQALGAEGRELIRQRFNALTRMVGGSGT